MQSMVEQCPADDPDTEVNLGCLLYKVVNCLDLYSSRKASFNHLSDECDLVVMLC